MITMTDIAEKAGVSRATVSLVLNERRGEKIRIPDATRERIMQAAHVMGYRPNELARSVRSGKSRMIGYLVNEPRYEPYWNTIIGALSEAEELDFTLKVLSVTTKTLNQRIQQAIELRLGGLIVRVSQDKGGLFQEAQRAGIPVVTVDEGIPQPFGIRVAADDAQGCQAAISHLVELGHQKIGFIADGFHLQSGSNILGPREHFFRQAMAARDLEIPDGFVTYETMLAYGHEIENEIDDSSALAATDALLKHPSGRPTAIFCWRDETAMAAMRACRQRGLRVPEDISIVGFSDISAARHCDPSLSTCRSPWDAMGRMAVRQLAHNLDAEFNTSPQVFLLPSGFVARQSSGPVPI
jgi:DNA-binding LacI/PurR family transcriptional regulator